MIPAAGSADLNFTAVESEPQETWSSVFTVDSVIPAGTPASEFTQFLVSEELPAGFAPVDAIFSLDQLVGMEAATDIPRGSVLASSLLRRSIVDDDGTVPGDDTVPDDGVIDPGEGPVTTEPVTPVPTTEPTISEPVEADLFPTTALWSRADSSTSVVYEINPLAREPLWVAERVDGSVVIQISKLADSREIRALSLVNSLAGRGLETSSIRRTQIANTQ